MARARARYHSEVYESIYYANRYKLDDPTDDGGFKVQRDARQNVPRVYIGTLGDIVRGAILI